MGIPSLLNNNLIKLPAFDPDFSVLLDTQSASTGCAITSKSETNIGIF